MYTPKHFSVNDQSEIIALIRSNPLAHVVYQFEGQWVSDPVPLLLDESGEQWLLRGHVARANPLWQNASRVLVIFSGTDAYISPQWYASKPIDGKVVPTWNYQVVHCHGTLTSFSEPEKLRDLVSQLTHLHESRFETPWKLTDAPDEYINKMLAAIVGIEIRVERIEAKFKMSQNKSHSDRITIASGLQAFGHSDASKAIQR